MKNIKLKNLRKVKGYTQRDIAEILKIDVSTYTKKENGQIIFFLDEVQQLKKIFNLSDKEFIEIFFTN